MRMVWMSSRRGMIKLAAIRDGGADATGANPAHYSGRGRRLVPIRLRGRMSERGQTSDSPAGVRECARAGARAMVRPGGFRFVRAIVWSVLIGVILSIATAVLAGLELLPTGASTTSMRLDLDGAHPFGASWLSTIDETKFGQTCRSTAVVSPGSYGLAGFAIVLNLVPAEPLEGAPAWTLSRGRTLELPVRMKPGDGLDEIPFEGVAKGVLDGSLGEGTLLIWPFEFRCGWPFRSMRYWLDGVYGWNRSGYAWDKPVVVGGIELTSPRAAGKVFTRAVPLQLLWPGMLGNILFYGAIILFTQWLVDVARRARRHRRGRCESCGHPLGGLDACPECGEGYAGATMRHAARA